MGLCPHGMSAVSPSTAEVSVDQKQAYLMHWWFRELIQAWTLQITKVNAKWLILLIKLSKLYG